MGSIVVLSPSLRENALGRALSVATLASLTEHEVRVFAPDDGPSWIGAEQYGVKARSVRSGAELVDAVKGLPAPIMAWAVKPLPSSVRLGRLLRRSVGALMVLDVDDDDAALSADFAAASIVNRIRLLRKPNLRSGRIRTELAGALVDGTPMTYSSAALAEALRLPGAPSGLRVPHPRLSTLPADTRSQRGGPGDDKVHIGFLGTPRLHKGMIVLRELLEAEPRYVLHLFSGPFADEFGLDDPQVRRHEGTAPLVELYAELDLVLLPQGETPGARLQLPAKLLDAMQNGVPTLATPTPPIIEIGGSTVTPVTDWTNQTAVRESVEKATASDLGRAAKQRFEKTLSAEAQLASFSNFVAWLIDDGPGLPTRSGS